AGATSGAGLATSVTLPASATLVVARARRTAKMGHGLLRRRDRALRPPPGASRGRRARSTETEGRPGAHRRDRRPGVARLALPGGCRRRDDDPGGPRRCGPL